MAETLPATLDATALSERLTQAAYAVTNDAHLRVHLWPVDQDATDTDEFAAERRARARRLNNGTLRADRLPGNVGLLELSNFFELAIAGDTLVAAMRVVAGTDALIIDLCRNGGGWPDTVAFLASYFFDEGEPAHLHDLYSRLTDQTHQYWTYAHLPGLRYGTAKPLFVLTSSATISAPEAFAYSLQAQGRAVIVGERTRGGAHAGDRVRLDSSLAAFIPNQRAIDAVTGTNWEGTGVIPDHACPAREALDGAHRLAIARLGDLGTLDPDLAGEVAHLRPQPLSETSTEHPTV